MGEGDLAIIHQFFREISPHRSGGTIIEAKSVSAEEAEYRPSRRKRDREQYAVAMGQERADLDVWYALRVKLARGQRGVEWRFCRPSQFSRTRSGQPVFRRRDGITLERFLAELPPL